MPLLNMETVVVGSLNKAKIRAAESAFKSMGLDYSVTGVNVPSDVNDQPLSDQETITGAINRAKRALESNADCKYGIGIEGGIHEINGVWFESGWCAVVSRDGVIGLGSSGRFEVSAKIMDEIHTGKELGPVVDKIMDMNDSRSTQGAMGIVTNGVIPRDTAYTHGIIFAFGKFVSDKRMWV